VARWAGFELFEWQSRVLAKACQVDARGRFTRTHVTLICPRRNGKTQLILARVLAECLLWSDDASPSVVLYTAHLGDTARHVFQTFLDLLARGPWLHHHVARIGYGKGDESVTFTNGARFHIRARTNSGGRGLECSTLILDEALELKDEHMSALTPLLAKAQARGSGQLWMVSSAGYGKSEVLAQARDRGRGDVDDGAAAYFEWCAPRDADPGDVATWEQANPSLYTDVLDARFLRAQYATMSLEAFGREHLGWWTDQAAEPFLPHGAWAQCATSTVPDLPDSARVTFGVELQDYARAAVLAAAVELPDGRAWVEVLTRWADPQGLDPATIADQIAQRAAELRPARVVGDDYTTAAVLDHLEAARVPVERLNYAGVREASLTLLTAVTSMRVLHHPDPSADLEMVNAGRASSGDGLDRLSRKNSTGPSTAAFAVAAALHELFAPAPATGFLFGAPTDEALIA
jgi:hypothetical protein